MIEYIEKKIINNEDLTNDEIKQFLDYIIVSVNEIVDDDSFVNKCDLVQGLIGRYLNILGVTNYPCITNKCIMPNVVGHSFIVADINNTKFIIDPTFIQFACIPFQELYIDNLRVKSKSPFYYAANIDEKMTSSLINTGYIELNEKSAYWYGNSFYHTLTNIKNDYIFNNISGKTYIKNFLEGNELLREYDYDEIKNVYDKSKKI